MLTVADHAGAMEVLKHPHMVQALYDAGSTVMGDVLLTLHGKDHSRRRMVEFGVFGRGFFRHYESVVFPATLAPVLEPYLERGRADVVELGYRVIMNLTADFAGIDRTTGDIQETETLLELIKLFSTAATLAHSHLDHDEVNRRAAEGMQLLDEHFLKPSIARRKRLLADGGVLPNDILATLLKRTDKIQLSDDVLRREIAFFLQAGAHSTANATVHALHEVLTWSDGDESRRARVTEDPLFLQRCVHESLRLHPASPVAQRRAEVATELLGQALSEGDLVVADLHQANRDTGVFGADAAEFNPLRDVPAGVWPWGLSFGYGTHACLGRELDGGVVPKSDTAPDEVQLGIVPSMVRTLLQHGARWIPGEPPQSDPDTTRPNFGTYPVSFDSKAVRRQAG